MKKVHENSWFSTIEIIIFHPKSMGFHHEQPGGKSWTVKMKDQVARWFVLSIFSVLGKIPRVENSWESSGSGSCWKMTVSHVGLYIYHIRITIYVKYSWNIILYLLISNQVIVYLISISMELFWASCFEQRSLSKQLFLHVSFEYGQFRMSERMQVATMDMFTHQMVMNF